MKPSEFLYKHNPVSRDEMEKYLSGDLSSTEHKVVEEKLVDDEFASEAAEGYQQMNVNFTALSSLDTAWNTKSKSIGTKGINYKYWFIGTAVVALASVTVLFMTLSNDEKPSRQEVESKTKLENENAQKLLAQKETTPLPITDAELKTEINKISAATPIKKDKQITYEKTIKEQPETVEETQPVKIIEISDPQIVDPKGVKEIIPDEKKVVESNVKLLYIKDLKVVDYTDFYTTHIAKKEWIMTGVTADKENATSEGVVNEQITKYIPYKDFLTETLTKFSKNDFKGTLSGLLLILQHYPDDINAAFYSGLCYYNLGKNKQAIAMFDKAIGNSINTFREEAEWYKCLSMIEKGEKEEAKVILKKIGDEGGFYAKRAKEKLKVMK